MTEPTEQPLAVAAGSERRMTLYEQLESGGLASLASMEGSWGDWDESVATPDTDEKPWMGLLVAAAVTSVAWLVHRLPFPPFTFENAALEHPVGVSVLAILLGMLVANMVSMPTLKSGCKWITVWCIPAAVVLLGARMDIMQLAGIGWGLLFLVMGLMATAIVVSYGAGRMLGMAGKSAYLLGVGTAVCGSSAILAVAPVTGADDEDVVVTVGVVNLVGLLAMVACVGMLWVMPMNADLYGAWAGATIHAVPQVVAAGESHGASAAAMATMVKLGRVTMLAPVVLLSALWVSRLRQGSGEKKKSSPPALHLGKYVPWFVWGFITLALIRAFGWLPVLEFHPQGGDIMRVPLSELFPDVAKWLLALSMAAIGLQVQIKPMLSAGAKALAAGVIAWGAMTVVGLLSLSWLLAS